MTLINSLISWIIKKRIHQIELFKKYPFDVQKESLKKLLETAQHTEWGERYQFNSIKTISDFQNRIPINNYDSLKKDIDRTRKGEQNILWPTEIRWFAKSSGTTSDKSKYIPVSNESLEDCHFNGGKDLIALYLNNYSESNLLTGKGLAMGGSHNITEINNLSYYDGDLSAILIQNLPFWAQMMKTPNLSIALMDEWENKIDKMANETIHHNVTSIAGVPSWTLVLMQKILEITKADNIKEVWPNLEVFFHGGVSLQPYISQYNKLIPKGEINYFETYNASEGFFAIQDEKDSNDMLLMLDYGIYYEFIPLDELEKENPKVLTLEEVEKEKHYALLITTNGGLWRYLIGDTVMFTSILPYKIKITGRTKNFINLVGEELIIDNAEKALKIACSKTNADITEYTAGPIHFTDNQKAGHEWLIEFSVPPKNIDFFTETFDNALKAVNSDYEAKRYKNMVLKKPVIHSLAPGTFYKWLKQKQKLGGQNKVPRLWNNRKHIDDIMQMISKN